VSVSVLGNERAEHTDLGRRTVGRSYFRPTEKTMLQSVLFSPCLTFHVDNCSDVPAAWRERGGTSGAISAEQRIDVK